jgi:hypothetical protein
MKSQRFYEWWMFSQLESVHDNHGDGAIKEDAEDTSVQWTNLGFVELDDVG